MPIIRAIDEYINQYNRKDYELQSLKKRAEELNGRLNGIPSSLDLLEEVRIFLQTLAEATRKEITAGLEEIVTRCLQSVFGPSMSFEIEAETKRNNVGLEFYVVDKNVVDPITREPLRLIPEDNLGGGVIDTISIGLRFGLFKVINPAPEVPFIFLDEPAKMVSGDRIDNIGNLIKELSDIFGKQIIMVTHHQPIMDILDNAIYVRNINGKTVIE